jgi:DNA-binding IclR family transcriptional regulator
MGPAEPGPALKPAAAADLRMKRAPAAAPRAEDMVKSARRVFEILELFARLRRPLTAVEIAATCGCPHSSASTILGTMVGLGYLAYESGARSYLSTARLPFLVDWIGTKLFDERRVRGLMQELSDTMQETIILGAQSGLRVQYVEVLDATGPVRLHAKAGDFRSLTHSAVGILLLSRLGDVAIGRLARRLNAEQSDPARHARLADLMGAIAATRQHGHTWSIGGITAGGGTIAMFLPESVGGNPLVIAIGAAEANLVRNREALVAAMRRAIARHYPPERLRGPGGRPPVHGTAARRACLRSWQPVR